MRMTRHQSTLGALAIAACLAPVLLITGLFVFSTEIDRTAREREQDLVAHSLVTRIEDFQRTAAPQAVWNDMLVRTLADDRAWLKENVGTYFMGIGGYELAGMLDASNRLQYAVLHDLEVDSLPDSMEAALAPLVAKVRMREKGLADIDMRIASGLTLSEPVQASAIERVDGRYVLLSVTLVQPDSNSSIFVPVSPLLVIGEEIDSTFLTSFADRMLLPNLRILPESARLDPFEAVVPIENGDGRLIAKLSWRPQIPGARLLGAAWPFLVIVVGLLGSVAFFFHREAHRAVQQLVNSEQHARHVALHDQLTGLPNRAHFSEQLALALRQVRRDGRPFAIHCLDLDRFKEVNDTYGHPVGDELIRTVANMLPMLCRQGDIVARLGGDEFAIIQRNTTPRGAAEVAERIISLMKDPIDLSAGRVFTGCSIGIGVVTAETAHDAQECLRMADLALYRAKDQGRGGYAFFETEMDSAIKARRRLQSDLRFALREGALSLHYQPQVDREDRLIGLEALARWTHPTDGPISPGVFIPVAEECGLIEEIGWFAMRRAFEDGARWPGLKIAVNVSASQLRIKDFGDRVERLASDTGIDPTRFEFEITEGLLLENTPETHATLKRLREIGFSIALDDFGTGYSSLSYLQRYPITRIKIDRSFVANLGTESDSKSLVAAIVGLASALGLQILAEGVETQDQRDRLAAAGCGDIQGFLTGRPMPVDQVEAFVDAYRKRAALAA
jgi:diguanylate cyclase (GGDEF)-like protein